MSPYLGPSRRERVARRIKSLRRFVAGVSFAGLATFAMLAAYHPGTTANPVQQVSSVLARTDASSPSESAVNSSRMSGSATLSAASSQASSSFRTQTASS